MKKKKIQNIAIVAIASIIIGSIIAYNYSVDQTKQKGLQFGVELEQIQEEVKELQIKFYSEKTRWEEGDISKEELSEYYKKHLKELDLTWLLIYQVNWSRNNDTVGGFHRCIRQPDLESFTAFL